MFVSKESRLTMKRTFEGRMWSPTETFQQYLHEKTIMANRLSIEEEELLKNLIEGIPDSHLRSQARMQCFNNRQQLAEAFSKIELPKMKAVSNKVADSFPSTSRRVAAAVGQESKPIRCFNCNSLGHIATECRKAK